MKTKVNELSNTCTCTVNGLLKLFTVNSSFIITITITYSLQITKLVH